MSPKIVGYNFYLNGVKVNQTLEDAAFTFKGLSSDTQYNLTATALDSAGRESAPSPVLPASTLRNGQSGEPMSAVDSMIIDDIVRGNMAANGQHGVCIGITSPKGFYTKSYGTSDGTNALTTDMHFRVGSITKTFTCFAVLMQVDRGKLSLDDTLDQYVSGIANGNQITIRDMLMMRSGIVNDQSNNQLKMQLLFNPTGAWSTDNTLAYIRSAGSSFEPGSQYEYTNSNYILMGYVLNAITGRTPRDIILNDIVTPLGLKETTWPTDAAIPPPFSHGYWNNPLRSIPIIGMFFSDDITNLNPELFGASGALTSTVGDMIKWGVELRDGSLLSDESHELLLKTFPYQYTSSDPKSVNYPPTYGYGLGFLQVGSWFGHDGSVPGFDSCLMFEPHTGSVITVWENAQTVGLVAISEIWADIANYLFPGSTLYPGYGTPQSIYLKGISPTTRFGSTTTTIFAPDGAPAGDANGATSVPHTVPFTHGTFTPRAAQTIELQGISPDEHFGGLQLIPGDRSELPHAVPHQI